MGNKKCVDFGLLCELAAEVNLNDVYDWTEEVEGPFFAHVIAQLAMDNVPMSPAVYKLGQVLDVLE